MDGWFSEWRETAVAELGVGRPRLGGECVIPYVCIFSEPERVWQNEAKLMLAF